MQVDFLPLVEFRRAQRKPTFRRRSGKIVLRQVRPVVWRVSVSAEHGKASAIATAAQHLGRREARRSSADNDDVPGSLASAFQGGGSRCRLLRLVFDEDSPVTLFRRPAVDRTEGGRAEGLAGAKTEAGMMPWTSYGVAVDDSLGQRPAVVSAGAADGEYLLARAHEDHGFFADMTFEDFTLAKLLDCDALRQVRTCRSVRFRTHSSFLRAQNGAPTCQLDGARSERFPRRLAQPSDQSGGSPGPHTGERSSQRHCSIASISSRYHSCSLQPEFLEQSILPHSSAAFLVRPALNSLVLFKPSWFGPYQKVIDRPCPGRDPSGSVAVAGSGLSHGKARRALDPPDAQAGGRRTTVRGIVLAMRVLVVEDDSETASYIRNGLTEEGHCVDVMADGRDGLVQATADDYDLLIVDRMLPGLDGLSLVRTLRGTGKPTPVLFLTSLGRVDDRVEGLEAGGDDYVSKPFSFAELLARVNALAAARQ